jgi:glycosyltransferase involved in cell wall biosynthesis
MKGLIVIPALGPVYGGTSKIAIELAKALGQANMAIDIVTTNANGSEAMDVPLGTWIKYPYYKIRYFPYWQLQDYKPSFSITFWLFQNVQNYDVVHTIAVFSFVVLAAHLACRFHKVPYVMNPQGMLEPWALSYKAGKKKLYYQFLEKPSLNQASAIQTLSSAEAEGIKPLNLNTPLVIIPNGLHREEFESLPNPKIFYEKFPHTQNKTLIVFLARIDPKKGLDLLASAFGNLYPRFPNTHLIIVGPDNIGFLPTAKDYFVQNNCLEAVTFTGILTGEMKTAALSAASLYVAPSYSEGFSMSVLEGMASGLPCVITTGCNFPEAEKAQVAKVVSINSEAITKGMYWCLSHPQEAKAMGDRARQFIFDYYTWDRIATKLLNVYRTISQN